MQIFISTINPLQSLISERNNTADTYWKKNADRKRHLIQRIDEFKKAFGEERTTIFAYHHQWLYGRSALLGLINILTIAKNAGENNNPFSESPYFPGEERVNAIKYTLSLFNSRLANLIGRIGIEGFRLLNFNQPEMKDDFTRGDNNDGVLIIDSVSKKYAFINIGGDSTINQLPMLEPVTAEQYVRLYYPQNAKDSLLISAPTDEKNENYWKTNTRINKIFIKAIARFEVLTKGDLKILFPKTYLSLNAI
jgi:hypothetical protein